MNRMGAKAIIEEVASGLAEKGEAPKKTLLKRGVLPYFAAAAAGTFVAVNGVVIFLAVRFGFIPSAIFALLSYAVYKLTWNVPSDPRRLASSERKLLQTLDSSIDYTQQRIPIGKGIYINSTSFHLKSPRPESGVLVMLHGLGCGNGVFIKNIPGLCRHYRTVHCVDLLGFGASSSPPFQGKSVECAVKWWAESLHLWRQQAVEGDDTIDLLGHSLGGFVAAHYALMHAGSVSRLILAAPAGIVSFKQRMERLTPMTRLTLRLVYAFKLTRTKMTRSLGPASNAMVRWVLKNRAAWYGIDSPELVEYMCHLQCAKISGEDAFLSTVCPKVGWREPLLDKLKSLDVDEVSLILGERDFIGAIGEDVQDAVSVPIRVTTFLSVGHHMHTTVPELFNQYVVKAM